MTPRHSEHPQATEELLDAVRYYHGQRQSLGDDFAASARAAVQDILDSPNAWPPITNWAHEPIVRARRFRVFPFRVIYYVRHGEIVVVAYAHERRHPEYWRQRLAAEGSTRQADSPDS